MQNNKEIHTSSPVFGDEGQKFLVRELEDQASRGWQKKESVRVIKGWISRISVQHKHWIIGWNRLKQFEMGFLNLINCYFALIFESILLQKFILAF